MKSRMVLVVSTTLFTAPLCQAGWVSGVNPKNVRANLSGGAGITFATNETIPNPAACSTNDFYGIASDANGHHKNALSILLTAIAMGRTVSVYVEESGCYAGRPLVTDVMMQ
jgi:hypothetical protein